MATFRSTAVTNGTSVVVNSLPINVLKLNITNRHSAVVYVRFYNSTVATFQDTPIASFAVPATATITHTGTRDTPVFGSTVALSVRAVTDAAESGNTAPGTLPVIEITY